MNLNLKMAVERSKRRSCFLSFVFITKCLNLSKAKRKKEKVRNIFIMFFCDFVFTYTINYLNETKKKNKTIEHNYFKDIFEFLYRT